VLNDKILAYKLIFIYVIILR